MSISFKKFLLVVTSLAMFINPILATPMEALFFEDWSKEQAFTRDYCVELKRTPIRISWC